MTQKYYGWGLPIDISAHGAVVDNLINVMHVFMAVLFVGWLFFFIYVVFRFRERPGHKAEYHTAHFKTPTYLEAGVALTEFVVLFAFSIPAWNFFKTQTPLSARISQSGLTTALNSLACCLLIALDIQEPKNNVIPKKI